MKFPRNNPSLIQTKYKGVKTLEFKSPNIKKSNANEIDQILISSPFMLGQNPITKKTIKKRIPKLLLDFFFFL